LWHGEQELQRVVAARVAQGLLIAGVAADVGAVGGRAAIMEAVHARWDGLDILVNNAGTNIRRATVDYALEQVVHLIDVNLLSAYELTRALYPLLRQGAGPAVVNVASVAGMLDVGSGSPYALTKAALIQVTSLV
jgi:Tropinone reductase 1